MRFLAWCVNKFVDLIVYALPEDHVDQEDIDEALLDELVASRVEDDVNDAMDEVEAFADEGVTILGPYTPQGTQRSLPHPRNAEEEMEAWAEILRKAAGRE